LDLVDPLEREGIPLPAKVERDRPLHLARWPDILRLIGTSSRPSAAL